MRDFANLPEPGIALEPRPPVALAWLQMILRELAMDPRDVTCVTFEAETFHVHHQARDQRGHLIKRDGKPVEDVSVFRVGNQPNVMASRTRPVRDGQDGLGDSPARSQTVEHAFPGIREPDGAPETLSDPHSDASRP